jgi:para-aminobenzoate synthetase/4-amino-4-deoxychorismate lyase
MPSLNSRPVAECFALLDDSTAPANARRARLYTGYAGKLEFVETEQLDDVLIRMQQALQQGLHAVALFPYQLGEKMHGIAARMGSAVPAQILLYEQCARLSSAEVEAWLQRCVSPQQPAGVVQVQAGIDEAAFVRAINRIHAYIEAGDTYQVNFTYRLHFSAYGPVVTLYRKLRLRQPVPYGALIALPDGGAIVSLSPELFLRHEAGTLTAQPMKGTAQATGNAENDALQAKALASDEKSRAENVMIVDLLRNDLGRVALPGSVRVPQLFEVTRFGSVLQMTSTITAQLRQKVTLTEIIRAVYPCGSITGAPKHRTMQIIRELEHEARGIYTGAIGWFDAPASSSSIGDFCLSVPIRTLELGAPDEAGLRKGEMGIGAGIVHDSIAANEYAECRLKGSFLTGMPHDFELFETMYATREGIRHLDRHLDRLQESAAFFGFVWHEAAIQETLRRHRESLAPDTAYRVRLSLSQQGTPAVQGAPLLPLSTPVRLLRAVQPTDAGNLFLRHKTTVRHVYDAAWRSAEQQGAFDAVFCNQHGHVTEGGRSSIFIRLDGDWVTPPLSAGVLPGVMRTVLLDDPAWNAKERNISWDDLRRAERIIACNALRGVLNAVIDWDASMVDVTV